MCSILLLEWVSILRYMAGQGRGDKTSENEEEGLIYTVFYTLLPVCLFNYKVLIQQLEVIAILTKLKWPYVELMPPSALLLYWKYVLFLFFAIFFALDCIIFSQMELINLQLTKISKLFFFMYWHEQIHTFRAPDWLFFYKLWCFLPKMWGAPAWNIGAQLKNNQRNATHSYVFNFWGYIHRS